MVPSDGVKYDPDEENIRLALCMQKLWTFTLIYVGHHIVKKYTIRIRSSG